ncbi:MAG: hypothetical protein Fur0032_14760 [Terrimicrobiaceae bacterium]
MFLILLGLVSAHAQDSQAPEPTSTPAESPAPAMAGDVPQSPRQGEATSDQPTSSEAAAPGDQTAGSGEVAVEVTETVVEESPASGGLNPSELPTASSEADGAPLITEDIIPLNEAADPAMPDDIFVDPNAIIPDQLLPPPSAVTDIESAAEKMRALNIRYREVRTRAESAPEVVAMKERADAARTAEDQRAALREYYRLLFKKVASLDSKLKDKAAQMEDAYIRSLAQRRLEPTIPLNPPPTPEPIN